ncbi:MAG: DNA gyrase inhibitor YacG [Planctomycetota bacterium]|nr:MAG: DNA gyrase inhibitor YacG [Planctomycetota bacterium]
MSMKPMICPICGCEFLPDSDPKAMPFCSLRCKRIDLGRWLDEAYGVPVEPDEEAMQADYRGDVSPRDEFGASS